MATRIRPFAYVVDSNGDLVTAHRDLGGGPFFSFAVTNSIDTLNLSLDATPDNVFRGQRDYINAHNTIIVQSGDATCRGLLDHGRGPDDQGDRAFAAPDP